MLIHDKLFRQPLIRLTAVSQFILTVSFYHFGRHRANKPTQTYFK